MLNTYTQTLLKSRAVVLGLMSCLVLFMALGSKNLTFTNDYQAFFSKENPQLLAYDRLQNTYTKNDNILIMLLPDSGSVFENDTLEAIAELTEKAWHIPYVRRVDSLTNYQYSYGEADDLIVEDLVSDPDTADLVELERKALAQPLLVDRLLSSDGSATAVNLTINAPGDNPNTEVPETVKAVRAIIAEFKQTYPQIAFHESGVVMLDNAMAEATIKDLSTLVPATYLIIALAVALFLWSWRATFATVIVVTLSIVGAMGMGGWIGIVLTPTSASVPPIIMTLAVADCVHIIKTIRQRQLASVEYQQAIIESIKLNAFPVFLTSITTAMGFLTLNFSDAPPFRDLGNLAAIGVILACLLSVTLLPAFLSLFPLRDQPGNTLSLKLPMQRIHRFVTRYQKGIVIVSALMLIPVALLIPTNKLNDNFVQYFDNSVKFRTDTDAISERLTGLYFIDYSIPSGARDGITDPQFLASLEQLEQWLQKQPEVRHVNAVTEIFRKLNLNLNAENPDHYVIPDQKDAAAQFLLLYEMSLPVGLDLNDQINVDKSATRLSVTLDTMSTSEVLAFESRVDNWMKDNVPALRTQGSSPSLMFSHISVRNINSMLIGTVAALILISAILWLPFRSMRLAMVSLVANVAPACFGFAIWALLVGQISLGVSVVIAMTLGIVVDDTIHFLSKYRYARRTLSLSANDAVGYVLDTVGITIVGTTVILILGFSVMAQSSFQVNSHMGVLSAITIFLAMVIDLLVVPALLLLFDKETRKVN